MVKNWLLGIRLNHHNHIEFNEHNKGIGFKPNTLTKYDRKNVCLSAAIISIFFGIAFDLCAQFEKEKK